MITALLFLSAFTKTLDVADSESSGLDADGDGYIAAEDGGDDCDDSDPGIHPGATDAAYDGVDSDCAGDSDYDADHDGHDATAHGGDDCDDADPAVSPSAEEVWYDGFDQDCDGADDYDQDADGFQALDHGGEDCDDTDPDSYPEAYDLPNDGVDQDCDGDDRSLDGAVVPEGETVEIELEFDLSGYGGMDVLILMDTTCSMGSALSGLSFTDVDAALSEEVEDLRYAYATFDDYAYGSYGTGSSGDRPFILRQQLTDDLEAAQAELEDTSLHGGADGPESSFEALYQSLTGAGYDQECDGAYDADTDVLPFIASADDAFGGVEVESYDSAVSGTGALGGVGFRSTALPVIVYVTDNYMRDPDAAYGAPGGCSTDAGASDVVTATEDLGAFLVAVATSTLPEPQMIDLAASTGSLVDTDGDGVGETEAVYSLTTSLSDSVIEALLDVEATVPLTTVYEDVSVSVTRDTYALVTGVSPESYSDVDTADEPVLTFTVTLTGTTSSTVALTDKLKFELVGDGRVLDTAKVDIEIPPG